MVYFVPRQIWCEGEPVTSAICKSRQIQIVASKCQVGALSSPPHQEGYEPARRLCLPVLIHQLRVRDVDQVKRVLVAVVVYPSLHRAVHVHVHLTAF